MIEDDESEDESDSEEGEEEPLVDVDSEDERHRESIASMQAAHKAELASEAARLAAVAATADAIASAAATTAATDATASAAATAAEASASAAWAAAEAAKAASDEVNHPPSAPAQKARKPRRKVNSAGSVLREELLRVARLQSSCAAGSNAEAAELLATLGGPAGPPTQEALRREEGAGKKRAHALRDKLFEHGGLSVTRVALRRLLQMPEVRNALPADLCDLSRRASDREAERVFLDSAKAFFTKHMAVGEKGGRRDNETQNAVLAAAVAITPSDIFKRRHGRALWRVSGIGYRLAKKASAERAELEDRAGGLTLTLALTLTLGLNRQ